MHPDRRRVETHRPAMVSRVICAFWVLHQTVSRSSAQAAAPARPSSGTGATRWFTIARSITTSQPAKLASSQFPRRSRFDDVALGRREQQHLAGQRAPAPGTAVSGSYSTLTSSAASSPW